jgi:hypothetical protein
VSIFYLLQAIKETYFLIINDIYSNKYMYPYATITAGIALYNVATIAALGAKAIAGNSASPSFEIALPISADNGMYPLR